MGNKKLSIMPYFGGKHRMAYFIADRLDYSTSTFVTMFGGACRVLLNKPPHVQEVYNDYGSGVCAVMEILSKPETAQQFIDRLYNETEYSKEQFDQAKKIYDFCETDFVQQYQKQLRQLLIQKGIVSALSANKFIDTVLLSPREKEQPCDRPYIQKAEQKLLALIGSDEQFKEELASILNSMFNILREQEENNGVLPRTREMYEGKTITDMDLAIATFIVFTFSFSGMGKGFVKGKFTDEQYKKRILKLYDCADRLKGIQVFQFDAMSFFKQHLYADDLGLEQYRRSILVQWFFNPDVCIFCDPSYIDPKDEARLLKDESKGINIDVDKVDNVSEAINEAWHDKEMPKNLGSCYARSFGYEEQEIFLQAIQDATCKMLVCNYNLALYDKYLTKEKGWKKEVFPTKTTASGRSAGVSNIRLECIWYNY